MACLRSSPDRKNPYQDDPILAHILPSHRVPELLAGQLSIVMNRQGLGNAWLWCVHLPTASMADGSPWATDSDSIIMVRTRPLLRLVSPV